MKAKPTQIALTESGGFAGIVRHYGCVLDDLTPAQAQLLIGLFEHSASKAQPDSPLRDALQYSLSIHSEATTRHCDLNADQAAQYAELFSSIRQLHRKSLP
jgi:hypothetical protein